MVEQHWLRRRLAETVKQQDRRLDLGLAALLLAQEHQPPFAIDRYLAQFGQLARRAADRLDPDASDVERLEALNLTLFVEEGFGANRAEYYDPQNSLLNEVLDRRTGIPITLSVVYLEVGWRLGLRLEGIGLPGHFVVVHHGPEGDIYLDPFNGGVALTVEDCRTLVRQVSGGTLPFRSAFLRPVTRRQILLRILGNLKAIYERADDQPRVLTTLDQLLIVNPDGIVELRERGLLYQKFRAFGFAAADFERCLALAPALQEVGEVRRSLDDIYRRWLN